MKRYVVLFTLIIILVLTSGCGNILEIKKDPFDSIFEKEDTKYDDPYYRYLSKGFGWNQSDSIPLNGEDVGNNYSQLIESNRMQRIMMEILK